MEKLVVEEEGLGSEGCFVGCYPEAPWEDPGDQAAGPFAASRGLRAALGDCCCG